MLHHKAQAILFQEIKRAMRRYGDGLFDAPCSFLDSNLWIRLLERVKPNLSHQSMPSPQVLLALHVFSRVELIFVSLFFGFS